MRILFPIVIVACLAGVAQAQPRPPMNDGSAKGQRPPAPFISPVGKPYRSAPDQPYAITAWFAAIDRGHKGYVTAADFEAEADGFYAELDVNRDGEIDPEEMARYENDVAPEVQVGLGGPPPGMRGGGMPPGGMPPGGPPGGMGGGPPGGMPAGMKKRMLDMPRGAAMFSLFSYPQPLAAADTNFNRGISRDELRAAARRRFTMLDTAQTGRLTLAELPKTPIEKMANLKR